MSARFVLATQAVVTALVAGWFATGHASAPDHGLQQVDVLSLHERVPGIAAVDGRPTMVVSPCGRGVPHPGYPVVVLPSAARRALRLDRSPCTPGYALVDVRGFVRYRTYDPGLADHLDEERVLLEHLR